MFESAHSNGLFRNAQRVHLHASHQLCSFRGHMFFHRNLNRTYPLLYLRSLSEDGFSNGCKGLFGPLLNIGDNMNALEAWVPPLTRLGRILGNDPEGHVSGANSLASVFFRGPDVGESEQILVNLLTHIHFHGLAVAKTNVCLMAIEVVFFDRHARPLKS